MQKAAEIIGECAMFSKRTKELSDVSPDKIPYQALLDEGKPVILKGVALNWGLVKAGLRSRSEAMQYLLAYSHGKKFLCYYGAPEINGRFFYNQDLSGLNYQTKWTLLDDFLEEVELQAKESQPSSLYIGSTTVDACLPGMRHENDLLLNDRMFENNPPLLSVWLGNRTVASAHFDFSNNMAVCLVGKRRFTLFPPEQIANLYPGPLEPTPGGQVVSMVNFDNPDFEAHPRFKQAIEAAEVAEIEPGDLLLYPAMWWHQVEALDDFNVMVNYWWNTTPKFIDSPQTTLLHALLSLRDRPESEKQSWKAMFDYYIFGNPCVAAEHIPENARGNLLPMDEKRARRLRAEILNRLNR